MSPSDRVAQLYPQTPGSLLVALYDSQGYGGGILTHLHAGFCEYLQMIYIHIHRGQTRVYAVCSVPERFVLRTLFSVP
jgi:hypothetical protein